MNGKLIFASFFVALVSCQTPRERNRPTVYPIARTFYHVDYPLVWKSTVEAFADYKLGKVDSGQGVIETDWRKGEHAGHFTRYGQDKIYNRGRFKLTAFVQTVSTGINVKLIKHHEVEIDTFKGWKAVATDAVIEKSILYRVGHLIAVKRYLKKYVDKSECADRNHDGICDDKQEKKKFAKKKKKKNRKIKDKKKKRKSKKTKPQNRRRDYF